jgi:hypothetical protein
MLNPLLSRHRNRQRASRRDWRVFGTEEQKQKNTLNGIRATFGGMPMATGTPKKFARRSIIHSPLSSIASGTAAIF